MPDRALDDATCAEKLVRGVLSLRALVLPMCVFPPTSLACCCKLLCLTAFLGDAIWQSGCDIPLAQLYKACSPHATSVHSSIRSRHKQKVEYGPPGGAAAVAAAEDSAGLEGVSGAGGLGGLLARRRLARHYLALASSQLDTLLGVCSVFVGGCECERGICTQDYTRLSCTPGPPCLCMCPSRRRPNLTESCDLTGLFFCHMFLAGKDLFILEHSLAIIVLHFVRWVTIQIDRQRFGVLHSHAPL
eukprot:scaffold14772_cov21-Tisochrysis_lutea.AAC.2